MSSLESTQGFLKSCKLFFAPFLDGIKKGILGQKNPRFLG